MEIYSTRGVNFPNGLPKLVGAQSHSPFKMQNTHPLHMLPEHQVRREEKLSAKQSFASLLESTIQGVEKLDTHSKKLSMQAVYDPDSVEVHQVLLAAEKARFVMNFTKTLSDGLIRTFRELSSPR